MDFLNVGNNKGMALGSARSTVDGRNTFSILCGKTSISQAPAKNSVLHCKYPAQNPFMVGYFEKNAQGVCCKIKLPIFVSSLSVGLYHN